MKKEKYVEDLIEGDEVRDRFAVKEKTPPKEYTKGWYFRLMVGDKTGKIPLVYWGGSEERFVRRIYESLKVGDVVEVKGVVSTYKGELQISINEEELHGIDRIKSGDYEVEEYIPSTERDVDEMFTELLQLARTIDNDDLYELVSSFLKDEDFVERFKRAPYSKKYNHNYLGGLLEHTLIETKLADEIAEIYNEVDRDLLLASAIIHDFGKVREYNTSTSIELTNEAQLVGHTVICERMIKEKTDEISGFPEDLKLELSHIVLSHHGDYEWGSPRSPRTEEAVALHHIDLLAVRLSGFLQAKDEFGPEDEEMIYVSKEGVQRPIFNR
ncbi:MAG: HD domain-containing protein [Candidatus Thermoplasmatota archaeon]|nr:HD domain-containing protein [Candidatus Thermoplasmatota archaeon]